MSFVARTELAGAPVQAADPTLGYAAAPSERREGLTIDFRSVGAALMRRRNWIVAPLLLGLLGGLFVALTTAPRYTSTVQILVDPRDVQVVKSDTPLRAPSPDGSATLAENAMIMLRSVNVQMQVVDKHRLFEDVEFVGAPGLIARLFGRNGVEDHATRRLRAMNALERRLATRRSDKSSIIEASVWTQEAQKSADLANSLAAAYLDQQMASEADTARRAVQATQARLDELGKRVERAERDVEDYRARNNLQASAGRLVSEQQMQELNTQLVAARARAADARAKYEAARRLSVAGIERGEVPEAVNSQLIGQLRLKYAEASRLEADARQRLGDRHPEMMSLAAQARDARAQIVGELSRIVRAAQAEHERAQAAEATLSQALTDARARTTDTSEASVRLRELERQAEASRSIYAAFLKRTRELAEQEDINPIAARVISPANPAQFSSSLSRSLAVVGLTVAGGLVGLFLTLLVEQFDGTLRNRRQFQELSGLPVLGDFARPGGGRAAEGVLRAPVMDAPRSPEALAAFRIADSFAAKAEPDRPRSVLFVGVSAVETAELTLNVAIAAAQAGWRVLMVDSNPGVGVSRHLEVSPGAGLREVLDGLSSLPGAILADERTAVRILPQTSAAAGPAHRSRPAAGRIAARILTPASGFELTFVDGGGWGLDGTAAAFAGAVDDIVLVVPAGRISSAEVRDALESLAPFRDRLAGIVTA